MRKKMLVIGMTLLTMFAAKISCSAYELLQTTDFKSGISLPWHISESDEKNSYSFVKDGKYTVHIDQKGTNNWDVQIRHREISIYKGHNYTVKFSLTATKGCKVYAKIGDQRDPYWEAWNNNWTPFNVTANEVLTVSQKFTAEKDSKDAEFSFLLGGNLAGELPYEINFISMSLQDEAKPPVTPFPTPPRNIRVNQLGYLPNAAKKATLKIDSGGSSTKWDLKNSSGTVVASGTTTTFGSHSGSSWPDHAAGENLQIIDFSSYTTPGKGYQLVAGSATSFLFDIGTDIYSYMKYDALKYFYHARSGTEIKMPYCIENRWSRPAGHAKDIAVPVSVEGYVGPESVDATGGWYDAGDHGKYMVNGGLALWILQNQYEHSKKYGVDDIFGDGKMNIPESGNKINDLLDESRWEMEWMLKMQIPEGYDRAGMAIHKMGDDLWTGLATRPDQDKQKRVYYPPTTAATLNLAACAAQAARIWKDIDPDFSDKCMAAAERAYKAAKANPAIFYPYQVDTGTYTYGDNYVEDDFYWAACEMYVTTNDKEYFADLKGYKESQKMPIVLTGEFKGMGGCFDRCATGGLGTLTLVLHKEQEFPQAVASIKEAADNCIEIQKEEGYGIPLAEAEYINNFAGANEKITGYPWDSNTYVVNKAIVLAYAFDLSGASKYFYGMTEAIDYLMGRNPLIQCYVSGYGENPLKYPHHRFFCPQMDPSFPSVPPGFLTGGPNSGCQDPYVASLGLKINRAPAQKCYVDNEESWSTNEVKINLNAALSWVTYYVDVIETIHQLEIIKPTIEPTQSYIIEDINKDGCVNMVDVVLLAKVFALTKVDTGYDIKCDLNNDGTINMSDIVKLAQKFGYIYKL
ncbi:glycoside hydrolase family 9 protein [Pseudobacteroides cellulosolvens]|nr:glycoside hydrolase family 9 protein [Pseudobacteroides cellulosolvens]